MKSLNKRAFLTINMVYTKSDIKSEIKRVSKIVNGQPSRNDIKRHGNISLSTIRRNFGNWSNAKEECGFDVDRKKWNKGYISKSEIIEEIQKMSKQYSDGKTLEKRTFDKFSKYSTAVCEKRYETWNDAILAAGLTPNYYNNVPKEEIVKEINKISEIFCDDEAPTIEVMEKESKYGDFLIRNAFGTWNDALREAGYTPNVMHDVTDEKLLEEIGNLFDNENCHSPPTMFDMDDFGKYRSSTYISRFGTWSEAIEKAGYQFIPPGERTWNKTPEEDIFQDVERIIVEECGGEFPTMQEYEKYTIYSRSMIQRRFGGLWKVAEEMGYKDENENWYPTGPDHYAWTGGYEYYYGESWTRQKQKAISRANNCEVCSDKRSYMDVHHITPKKYWFVDEEHEQMNHLRNLVYLCRSCHRKLEGKFKGRNYEEFKRLAKEELGMTDKKPEEKSVFNY